MMISRCKWDDDLPQRDHPCLSWRHHRPTLGRLEGFQQVETVVTRDEPERSFFRIRHSPRGSINGNSAGLN